MKLRIFTPCWGKKHIDLLASCLCKSLLWPKNRAAIDGAQWIFVCDSELEAERIRETVRSLEFSVTVTPIVIPGISLANASTELIVPLVSTIRSCIQDKAYFLMATPDFIFGDGTIDTFKIVGAEYGSCVSIAHMRVLPDILKELPSESIPNSKLQSLGFKYPHGSWTHANASLKENCSHAGGVRWWDVGNNVKCVEHHLTSPFFVSFFDADVDVFYGKESGGLAHFMIWDHHWPQALFKYGRFKYIGSSDAAMMLEVTDPDANMPALSTLSGCSKNAVHNRIQKQFISVFRGE